MKAFITSLILISTLASTPQARAAEVTAIVVGGVVAMIATAGTVALVNGGTFKAEAFHEAVDAVAAWDESLISPELSKIVKQLKLKNESLKDSSDLEIIEAILNAEIQ
jgi:hypothetical protein